MKIQKSFLPKNHSIWLIFSLNGSCIWFDSKEEADLFLIDADNSKHHSKPIKYCRDY
jgi:hypothetical protein